MKSLKNSIRKGSMKRLAPFDKNKEKTGELRDWALNTKDYRDGSNSSLREVIPQASPAALMRMKNKLHGQTKTRRNPVTGEREFLLFRGVGINEMESSHKGEKISHDKMTSWTPKFHTAYKFAVPHRIEEKELPESQRGYNQTEREQALHHLNRGRMKESGVLAAWIPESAIHSSPDQHGVGVGNSLAQEYGFKSSESEIIVKPHTSDVAKTHEYYDSINNFSGDPIKDSPLKKEIEHAVWEKKREEGHLRQEPYRDRQATAYHVAALRGKRGQDQKLPELTKEQHQRLDNYSKVLEQKYKKTGEGSRGGHIVGHTKSGKPIYQSQKVASMKSLDNLYIVEKLTKSEIDFFKAMSGEGSRGGRIIGHTKSGKPIYESGYHHPSVKDFSIQDHKDAKRMHIGFAEFLDPHPEEGGGGHYYEGFEHFDPNKDPKNFRERAKHHMDQVRLHDAHIDSATGQKPNKNVVFHEYIARSFQKIKDMIHGGLADKKKPKDFDKKQLAAGRKVEMEHTNNPKVAQEIAMDHLTEDPNYYIKLKKIEKGGVGSGIKGHVSSNLEELGFKQYWDDHWGRDSHKPLKIPDILVDHRDNRFVVEAYNNRRKDKYRRRISSKEFSYDQHKEAVEHIKELLKIKELKKSEYYVSDFIKSVTGSPRAGHKYIKRYKRGDKWIYVYHEAGQHGRRIEKEHLETLKRLADSGHQPAKDLLKGVEDHNEETLTKLRRLADQGFQPAIDHLKALGIDRELEKLEEIATPPDSVTRNLSSEEKQKALEAVKKSAKVMFDRFRSHSRSVFETAATTAGLRNEDDVVAAVSGGNSLKEILDLLNQKVTAMEASTPDRTPSFDEALNAGGYANMVYNKAVKNLQTEGLLPANYHEAHVRTKQNAATLSAHPESEHAAKMAEIEARRTEEERQRAERERLERERREAEERAAHAELEGSMASYMNGLLESPRGAADTLKLHKAIKNVFGKNLRKEDFPYDFAAQGIETKIESVSVSDSSVTMNLAFYKNGMKITSKCERTWKSVGGRPAIKNSYLTVPPSMRDGTNVSNFINRGQRDLLRSIPGGGQIFVYANINIGGYTWANCGFSTDEMPQLKRDFKSFLSSKGIRLTEEEWRTFTDPVHIAQFDIGKKSIRTMETEIPLSRKQIETGSISGVVGKHPLTEEEIRTGKSKRIAMSVGKEFLLAGGGRNWNGTWDSNSENETTKFADNYYNLRDEAVRFLSPAYLATMERAKNVASSEAAPAATPATTTYEVSPSATYSSPPPSMQESSESVDTMRRRYSHWIGSNGRITIRQRRLHLISRWSSADKESFIRAFGDKLTRDAIRKIRTTTPDQASEARVNARARRRENETRRHRARLEAATSSSDPSLRSTQYAGAASTHGEVVRKILSSNNMSEPNMGTNLAWYGGNKQHLTPAERQHFLESFTRRAEQIKRVHNQMVDSGKIPADYMGYDPDRMQSYWRNMPLATRNSTSQDEKHALTDMLNMAMYRDSIRDLVGDGSSLNPISSIQFVI